MLDGYSQLLLNNIFVRTRSFSIACAEGRIKIWDLKTTFIIDISAL